MEEKGDQRQRRKQGKKSSSIKIISSKLQIASGITLVLVR